MAGYFYGKYCNLRGHDVLSAQPKHSGEAKEVSAMRKLFWRAFRAFEKALGEQKYLERRQLPYADLVNNTTHEAELKQQTAKAA